MFGLYSNKMNEFYRSTPLTKKKLENFSVESLEANHDIPSTESFQLGTQLQLPTPLKELTKTIFKRVGEGFITGAMEELKGATTKKEQAEKFGALLEKIVQTQEAQINSFMDQELQNNSEAVQSLVADSQKIVDIVNKRADLGFEERQMYINVLLINITQTVIKLWNPAEFEKKQHTQLIKKEKQEELKIWTGKVKEAVSQFSMETTESIKEKHGTDKANFNKATEGIKKYASKSKVEASQSQPPLLVKAFNEGIRTSVVGSIEEVVKEGTEIIAKNLLNRSTITALMVALTGAVVTSVLETGVEGLPTALSSHAETELKIDEKNGKLNPTEDKNKVIAKRVLNAMMGVAVMGGLTALCPVGLLGNFVIGVVSQKIIDTLNPIGTSEEEQINLARVILTVFPQPRNNSQKEFNMFLLELIKKCPDEEIKKELLNKFSYLMQDSEIQLEEINEISLKEKEENEKKVEENTQISNLAIKMIISTAIYLKDKNLKELDLYQNVKGDEGSNQENIPPQIPLQPQPLPPTPNLPIDTVKVQYQSDLTKSEEMVPQSMQVVIENVKKAIVLQFNEELDFISNQEIELENPSTDPVQRILQTLHERKNLMKKTLKEYSEIYENPTIRFKFNQATKIYLSKVDREQKVVIKFLNIIQSTQTTDSPSKQEKKITPASSFKIKYYPPEIEFLKELKAEEKKLRQQLKSDAEELVAVEKARMDLNRIKNQKKRQFTPHPKPHQAPVRKPHSTRPKGPISLLKGIK